MIEVRPAAPARARTLVRGRARRRTHDRRRDLPHARGADRRPRFAGSDDRSLGRLRSPRVRRRAHLRGARLPLSAGRRPLRLPARGLGLARRVSLRLAVFPDPGSGDRGVADHRARRYLVVLWPGAAGHERWLGLATIWILALCHMAGLRLSTRALNALTALKLLAIGAVVVGAFTIGDGSWSHFEPLVARRPGAPPLFPLWGSGSSAASSRSADSGKSAASRVKSGIPGDSFRGRSRSESLP